MNKGVYRPSLMPTTPLIRSGFPTRPRVHADGDPIAHGRPHPAARGERTLRVGEVLAEERLDGSGTSSPRHQKGRERGGRPAEA